jgi:hypothetical protein
LRRRAWCDTPWRTSGIRDAAVVDAMLRLASTLFVIGIALALVGLALDDGVLAVVARMGFYTIIPIALVVALVGMLRMPKPRAPVRAPDDDVPSGRVAHR